MSNYRAGDVIRLTRIANGISQEALSDGICSVQTLHRIENGKTRVKQELYRKLMEKMERIPEKNYAVCVGRDMELLEERFHFENAMNCYDYENAEKHLNSMKEHADNNIITEQYLKRAQNLLLYYQKKIDEAELIRQLEASLSLTVPDYMHMLDKNFPFTEQELLHLMSIANAYAHQNQFDDSILILKKVICCIEMEYMSGSYTEHIKLICKRNLAVYYSKKGEYKEAILLLQECVEPAKVKNEGKMLLIILNDISCVLMNQIEAGEKDKNYISDIKKYMKQSYYIALAKDNKMFAQKESKHFMEFFHEEI